MTEVYCSLSFISSVIWFLITYNDGSFLLSKAHFFRHLFAYIVNITEFNIFQFLNRLLLVYGIGINSNNSHSLSIKETEINGLCSLISVLSLYLSLSHALVIRDSFCLRNSGVLGCECKYYQGDHIRQHPVYIWADADLVQSEYSVSVDIEC